MDFFRRLKFDERVLYSDKCFSGDYNQFLYLKRSVDDGSNRPKIYINLFTKVADTLMLQGYLYFYLDFELKKSYFIGLVVKPEYRNLNIGSFLIATWINLCIDNGYDFLGINQKQRKPFLIYLLKTYGFEISDLSLYSTSDDLITILHNLRNNKKIIMFRSYMNELAFRGTNVYKADNYIIVHNPSGLVKLDDIILPFQNRRKINLDYELRNYDLGLAKAKMIISKHTK